MRLRRNWQGEAALPDMPGVLRADLATWRQDWTGVFGREAPLHVEIGAGKGDFVITSAKQNPGVDYVGIERSPTILYIAVKKNQSHPLPNLRFLPVDAESIASYFRPGQIARIYLNFSDPWPKTRHADRRLTAGARLSVYATLLKPGGQLHFKTDRESFFDFSLRMLIREGWSVARITRDLARSGFEANVLTEYERRFMALGQPICRLEAWRPS